MQITKMVVMKRGEALYLWFTWDSSSKVYTKLDAEVSQ